MTLASIAKSVLHGIGLDPRRSYLALSAASLRAAQREQKLAPLMHELRQVVPDILDQYTAAMDIGEYERYWEIKMRGMHAFQIRAVLDALSAIGKTGVVIADIGDSSGTHAAYIRALAKPGQVARFVSINMDSEAIDKIRAKGGEAILCRAEELDLESIRPDLMLSFETLEHLTDPVRFLHRLATQGDCQHLLVSVPYRRQSRFGGHLLRLSESAMPARMTAEQVHVHEFSAEDWLLLSRFAGWRPVFTRIYRQFPLYSPLRVTTLLWRKLDFEGFFATLLVKDLGVTRRYADW